MSKLLSFPESIASPISGLSVDAENDCALTINLKRPISDSEMINLWLHIKNFVPSLTRPEGWEPIDKSNPEEWQEP